jgi:WD40 repeat protein
MFPPVEHEGGNALPVMPPGSFVTCSSDDTIRVWNLESNLLPDNDTLYKRNIYSNVSILNLRVMNLFIQFQGVYLLTDSQSHKPVIFCDYLDLGHQELLFCLMIHVHQLVIIMATIFAHDGSILFCSNLPSLTLQM